MHTTNPLGDPVMSRFRKTTSASGRMDKKVFYSSGRMVIYGLDCIRIHK